MRNLIYGSKYICLSAVYTVAGERIKHRSEERPGQLMMLTGDHPATAVNIANQLHICEQAQQLIVGKEMKPLSELTAPDKQHWHNAGVFARVSPRQKPDLVSVLQENHDSVAMTGDGVNDAPALKKADIGMGIRQGRIIFDNIRMFVIYLLSCNLSELLVIGLCAAFNLPFQLFALQILFINLITDVPPAMAPGAAEGNQTVMKQTSKDPSGPLIDKKRWISIWVYALVIAAATPGAAMPGINKGETGAATNNVLFFTLILCQLLHVLNMASGKEAFFNNEIIRNKLVWIAIIISLGITLVTLVIPALSQSLRVTHMHPAKWALTLGFSFGSVIVIRILKSAKVIL